MPIKEKITQDEIENPTSGSVEELKKERGLPRQRHGKRDRPKFLNTQSAPRAQSDGALDSARFPKE